MNSGAFALALSCSYEHWMPKADKNVRAPAVAGWPRTKKDDRTRPVVNPESINPAIRGASRHHHQGRSPRQPERRIHPAGGRVALGLPDKSGVPVVVSGCARRLFQPEPGCYQTTSRFVLLGSRRVDGAVNVDGVGREGIPNTIVCRRQAAVFAEHPQGFSR